MAPWSVHCAASPALGRSRPEGQEFGYVSLWLLRPPPRVWASRPEQRCQPIPKQERHSSLQTGLLVSLQSHTERGGQTLRLSESCLGFSGRLLNDTPIQTLSPGGKPSPSLSLPPQGQRHLSPPMWARTPATSCQGLVLCVLSNRCILGGRRMWGSTSCLTLQVMPTPPSAACPLKEQLLNSQVVKGQAIKGK